RDEHFNGRIDIRLKDRKQGLLGTRRDADFETTVARDELAQRKRSRVRRVVPRTVRGGFDGELTKILIRFDVRLADAEVDAERRGQRIDLADERELDIFETLRRLGVLSHVTSPRGRSAGVHAGWPGGVSPPRC